MVNSIKTNSTKSSISGKATSLKKSVQKGAKAIAWPFKKLKKSISTASTRSICSCSSITVSVSDDEDVNRDDESSINGQGDSNRSEPEVELTPQEALSMSFITILSSILIISTSEALQEHWHSPIYTFFKPNIVFQYHDGRPCHFFTCATPKCKVCAGGVHWYQNLKDKLSTANLKHHALCCFGGDVVNTAVARKECTNHSRGILAFFCLQRQATGKVFTLCPHKPWSSVHSSTIYSYTNADHW